jgi:uncharacterized protein (TIGR02117 family)
MKQYLVINCLLLIIFCLLSACSSKPYVVENSVKEFVGGPKKIYVVSHGWHTGFVIPAADIQGKVSDLKKRFPHAKNIEFGWGDKGFYQANEITTGLTLRAIFWPTESVIHAVAVPDDVQGYFENSAIEILCLDKHEYSLLITFISNSFARDVRGDVLSKKKGIYGNSQFYTGVGDYYLMNTCNKWTAKGLRSIGLPIAPAFKLTAGSVMNFLDIQGPAITQSCQNSESSL